MSKNIKKIQNMLLGKDERKIQVGVGDQEIEPTRKVGDKWTDSDGDRWEQKDGFKVKLGKLPGVGLFRHQCKSCEKNCVQQRDIDTFKRMGRCFHCQINFEVDLKTMRIGENSNKWHFWVKLQALQRWDAIDKEYEEMMLHNLDVKHNDKSLLNAIANFNQEETRNKINKTKL